MASDEDIINSGRDERGRFVKTQVIMQAAQRAVAAAKADTERATKAVEKLKAAYAAIRQQTNAAFAAQSKGWKAAQQQVAKSLSAQTKAASRFYSQLEKQRRADSRLQAKLFRQEFQEYRRLAREKIKAARAGSQSGRGASGGGGFSLGLGPLAGILSVAALTAGLKKMSDYITETAWSRERARAMGGPANVLSSLGNRRDVDLYNQYAQQGFSNRFAGATEIEGLKALRDELQAKLGEQYGQELTLKLTESLKNSRAELQQFLAMASQDVPRALEVFQSADIDNFSTALAAARQKGDELSKTAFTIEQAWRDVKDAFEQYVKSFVEANGGDLRATIQQFAQGMVDAINWGRQWAAEMKPVFEFIMAGFRQVAQAWEFWSGRTGEKARQTDADRARIAALGNQTKDLLRQAEQAKAAGQTDQYNRLVAQIKSNTAEQERILSGAMARWNPGALPKLKLPEQVAKVKTNMDAAVQSTKTERQEIERMLTPIQQAALNIQRFDESLEVAGATLKRDMARLNMLESSPLGFGQMMQATVDTVKDIDSVIDTLNAKLAEQNAIIAENAKAGRDSKDDRIKALDIESEINDRMAERNKLLAGMQRGYLDAIGAMAMGAGKFEKFIVGQDRNVRRGLAAGMIRNNPLVGGLDGGSISPFRFSTNMDSNLSSAMDYERSIRGAFKDQLPAPFLAPRMPQQVADLGAGTLMQRPGGGESKTTTGGSGATTTAVTPTRAADKLVSAGEMLISAGRELRQDDPRPPRPGRMSAQ